MVSGMVNRQFAIHGDNIVECERTLGLIELALAEQNPSKKGPFGSPTNPSFEFELGSEGKAMVFTFFPGFGRWDVDILQLLLDRGGIIREAPDVIISDVTSGQEVPLIAMEYSGALAAGNQAWQRSGRAFSSGLAQLPYLYVAELGGNELNAERTKPVTRLPNPAVPFSYLSFSCLVDTPVLPVLVLNPGANESVKTDFASVIGEDGLIEFIRVSILNQDAKSVTATLKLKGLEFVQRLASGGRVRRTLTPEQWSEVWQAIVEGDRDAMASYLLSQKPLNWTKTAYIKTLTESARELMNVAAKLGIGLTSSQLPICLISPEKRAIFAQEVGRLYPGIGDDFLDWLRTKKPLSICWVMGFKPKGEDARPDRGLPPFTRMLIGPGTDILTVVYGPAPPTHWGKLLQDPGNLALQNGLWQAIMAVSDAVLADSSTDSVTTKGFLRSHWDDPVSSVQPVEMLVTPKPAQTGEHDVDTVIHTLFAHLGGDKVFEGLCNPPGGDWSGISLLSADKAKELRWLSLPRVSGLETKRPDHVLQLFGLGPIPVIFAIESKETPGSVEKEIGPRLTAYISNLVGSPASIERETTDDGKWQQSDTSIGSADVCYASAAAFLIKDYADLHRVREKAGADLQMGLWFSSDGAFCEIHLLPSTAIGKGIAELIDGFPLGNLGLSVHIRQ